MIYSLINFTKEFLKNKNLESLEKIHINFENNKI